MFGALLCNRPLPLERMVSLTEGHLPPLAQSLRISKSIGAAFKAPYVCVNGIKSPEETKFYKYINSSN